jgi:hypothetical protein
MRAMLERRVMSLTDKALELLSRTIMTFEECPYNNEKERMAVQYLLFAINCQQIAIMQYRADHPMDVRFARNCHLGSYVHKKINLNPLLSEAKILFKI